MTSVFRQLGASLSWIRTPFTFGETEEGDPDDEEGDSVREEDQSRESGSQDGLVQSTKYNGLISSVVFFICIVAVVSVLMLSEYAPGKSYLFNVRLVLIACMVTGLAIMISIYKCRERFVRLESGTTEKRTIDSLVLIGILTFGSLSTLFSISVIVEYLTCSSLWIRCQKFNRRAIKDHLIRTLYHAFKIIYIVGQTAFCMLFRKLSFANSSLARHGLMFLQVVNMVLWVRYIIDVTRDHFYRGKYRSGRQFETCLLNDTVGFSRLQEECTMRNNSLFAVVRQYAYPTLRPFMIEYTLLVGESLAHWFVGCGGGGGGGNRCRKPGDRTGNAPAETRRRRRAAYDGVSENDFTDSTQQQQQSRILSSPRRLDGSSTVLILCVGLSVLSNLLLCVFAFNTTIIKDLGDTKFGRSSAYYGYYSGHQAAMTLSVLIGYAVSNRFQTTRHAAFSGLEYMLIFTSAGPLTLCSFRLVTDSKALTGAYGFSQVLVTIQVYTQVTFALYAGRVVVEKRRGNLTRRACFRAIVAFLALSNGCLWCIHTFNPSYLGKHALDKNYEDVSGVVVKSLVEPVSLFFRFSSCLVLSRVFLQTRSRIERRQMSD